MMQRIFIIHSAWTKSQPNVK